MWSTVSELAGCAGVPATERGCRKFLDNLASKNPSMRRKRTGTKAFEYHIDSLPIVTQEELKNRYYKEILSTQQVSKKETKTSSNIGSSDNGKLALIRQCPALLEREVGSLTDKQKEIADARAVLAMEVEKLRDAGMSRTAAVNYISIESRKGTLPAHLLKAAEMANARKGSSRAGVGTRSLREWLTIFESTKPGVERMAMLAPGHLKAKKPEQITGSRRSLLTGVTAKAQACARHTGIFRKSGPLSMLTSLQWQLHALLMMPFVVPWKSCHAVRKPVAV